jgi:hypothetical protein
VVIKAVTACIYLKELTMASRKYSRATAKQDKPSLEVSSRWPGKTGRQRCVRHVAMCASALLPVIHEKAKTSRGRGQTTILAREVAKTLPSRFAEQNRAKRSKLTKNSPYCKRDVVITLWCPWIATKLMHNGPGASSRRRMAVT